MSWQTPDGDRPPEPAAQPPDAAPEPDAETARVPVAETPNTPEEVGQRLANFLNQEPDALSDGGLAALNDEVLGQSQNETGNPQ